MDPISEIEKLDLRTAIESVYGPEQQIVRHRILSGTATHEEIIANYTQTDPLNGVLRQDLTDYEGNLLLAHTGEITYANFIGGLTLLYDTSPTVRAIRDEENTQNATALFTRLFVGPDEQPPSLEDIDHRIIDLHTAYSGRRCVENIHLLSPASTATRLIGAQCLRSAITDMQRVFLNLPHTKDETVGYNLALEAAEGVVFGSMFRLSVDILHGNNDAITKRENLGQLLEAIKIYIGPMLTQTDEVFTENQRRDFGMACVILGKVLGECSTADLKSSLVKGNLHELLWLLDAFTLTRGDPEEYGSLNVIPADYAQDRGNIKNLTLRRGFDFCIYNQTTKRHVLVQLKSHTSRRNDKPYAEGIDVYREEDFHKSVHNPTLITDKLSLYYEWSLSDFSPESFKDLALGTVIMSTAKEALDNLKATND